MTNTNNHNTSNEEHHMNTPMQQTITGTEEPMPFKVDDTDDGTWPRTSTVDPTVVYGQSGKLDWADVQSALDVIFPGGDYDTASEYGEPRYHFYGSDEGAIVFANWNCYGPSCPDTTGYLKVRDDGTTYVEYHGIAVHYPVEFAVLEATDCELEWYDEWWVDYATSKAWRTEPDSYGWQPQIQWSEGMGDFLTPDNDIEDWIDWARNNPSRAISGAYGGSDLILAGFTEVRRADGSPYMSGWYDGQDDNPQEIFDKIILHESPKGCNENYKGFDVSGSWHPDDYEGIEVVFAITSVGQFDMRFEAYYRIDEDYIEDED